LQPLKLKDERPPGFILVKDDVEYVASDLSCLMIQFYSGIMDGMEVMIMTSVDELTSKVREEGGDRMIEFLRLLS